MTAHAAEFTPKTFAYDKDLLDALIDVRNGNFSVRLPNDWEGIHGRISETFNEIVHTNENLARELLRLRVAVGKKGQISQRVSIERGRGQWAVIQDSVNSLIDDSVRPVTEMARVIGAVANGDLSQTVSLDVEGIPLKGEFSHTAKTVNTMVERLAEFAAEVTRVAREVGTEGKLGGQANVKGLAGTWRDLTDSVNSMAANLTGQVRNISEVTVAVASGDLSKKITVDVRGEFLQMKETINTMVDQLRSFAAEVTRVAREVGLEGRLGGQAFVPGVAGTWKDLTDSVNSMAANLTSQVRNIAEVTTAIATGDLSRKITVDVKGEILELKNTINTLVDQLNAFASEVTRVAREVGTEGKLGGQAGVPDVGGTWKDLTDGVNSMANNLTAQVRNIAEVTTAVARGDLSHKITVDVKGEILELKNTINTMVDQLRSFAAEVTRVAREVGTEGRLGGQAEVPGVAGTWKDLTDNVNSMANNLTAQVRNIAEVTVAVASGDLSRKITVNPKGEILELKNTMNAMVDQLNAFASEVTRVAREVGTEGALGGQAVVPGVGGTWKDLTDSVNYMANNLTAQVRNIAEVTTAVARGDLSRKSTVDAKGEILELKNTINAMVDQLNGFASEVTRVAREVGTEGKLGGQAEVPGAAGTWKDLTDGVNSMAANLTAQVRNIAEVTTSVATGDLSKKITVDVRGEILQLKETVNTMVDQLRSFAAEVTRVAREVGTEGKLGGQAFVTGIAGVWKDLTDSVNSMANNLTTQVRNIAEVTTAVARGDLSRKSTVDAKGEILELKNTINAMVDQLNGFASEVTRVAREVGTEGKLGGQAAVPGAAGTWKDLTDGVNSMANNLTAQVRNIAEVTTSVASGDLSKKITVDVRGEILQLKETVNTMVDQLRSFAAEVTRVAREVGTDGRLGGQAFVTGVAGVWKDLTDSVNYMANNLTAQVRNIAEVTTAVARGDLSRKSTVDAKGEILELKNTINAMVDQLNSFASEVTRVAREVGTEGKLGGKGEVPGVAGVWKDLTDNVNIMAENLTDQVRSIAKVVTAVASGNLRQRLTLPAKGEIAVVADTINSMIETLATFADQVTTVAREVGVEGRLGGQANVPGAAGTWKDLTDNVNQLAANLTNQVRAITDVATSVTRGDLTRNIQVEAHGEVAELKDNINEMIGNLRDTTLKNTDQDWLKSNLAKFTRMMQGQRDLETVGRDLLVELAPLVNSHHGLFYWAEVESGHPHSEMMLKLVSTFGYEGDLKLAESWKPGQGLVGQVAQSKRKIIVSQVPEGYFKITSGTGTASPSCVILLPAIFEGEVKAVLELASFQEFSSLQQSFLEQLVEGVGIVINNIEGNTRTEDLLKQSQGLTQELQIQQRSLEEKAEQLQLASKYKSEFLANMSHELRTPLNSLLILSEGLAQNAEGNLTSKQVEFSRAINSSGNDLLSLINDVLDLSKIESGTVAVHSEEELFAHMRNRVDRTFRHVAESKNLSFNITLDPALPAAIHTDAGRLEQVLKNLLSNSFKFTERGSVSLQVLRATTGWTHDHAVLSKADQVVAFAVTDSGIGIAQQKAQIIFEAFQQADSGTSRKYGGTGLGLAISRELAQLLGGELLLTSSKVGVGSTFTLYLPLGNPALGRSMATVEAPSVLFKKEEPFALTKVKDDRNDIHANDKVLLIVEDDPSFAEFLMDTGHSFDFKCVVALRGRDALPLLNEYKPTAITLDVFLPDIDGWNLLDRMKTDSHTRHIPVCVVSSDEGSHYALDKGAFAFVQKPVTIDALKKAFARMQKLFTNSKRHLLLVEDNEIERAALLELLEGTDLEITAVGTGAQAIESLANSVVDCMVLDLTLPDISGLELLRRLQEDPNVPSFPIIVHTGRELSLPEADQLKSFSKSIIVKDVHSPERLLEKSALFLHRRLADMSPDKRGMIERLAAEPTLQNKKILIVDDDFRNIFSLTAVLERYNATVLAAENGRHALEMLDQDREIDLVLMDIMMPEMDGYETTRRIRELPHFRNLPIITLTAKAMKGDREKCLDVGASDYIAKPVNIEQLMSLLRLWLYR